jgi:peptide/nickel transport system ATP-binding protein
VVRGLATKMSSQTLIEVRSLKKYFDVSKPLLTRLIEREPRKVLKAVDDVSFTIDRGETFSLVGESGCGKSTVAKLIAGLYQATSGTIKFGNTDIDYYRRPAQVAAIRRHMQMIFQDPHASLNPRWRIADIISEPIKAHRIIRGKGALRTRVHELLHQVGLNSSDAEKYPHEFSGGQRQRISIARALSSNANFIICDEPTSALDVSVQAQILNLMKGLQRNLGLTYLFISHDLSVIYHVSDRVAVMYLGKVVEMADTRTVFRKPRHPYTRMLLDVVPDLEMTGRQRIPVAGEVPSPIDPPNGCSFHPRCPWANDRCQVEEPQLRLLEESFVACHAVEENRLNEPASHNAPIDIRETATH